LDSLFKTTVNRLKTALRQTDHYLNVTS